MKKLMIAAAAVAVSAGAYAKTQLDAQVYDFTLTVKTTECKQMKFTKSIAKLEFQDYNDVKKETIDVRKPASTKIVGVIWGCDCITIAAPMWRSFGRADANGNRHSIGGYLFWNPSTEEPFNVWSTRFGWAALNRMYKGDSAEGVWRLSNWDPDNTLGFIGAGQGKVKGDGLYLNATTGTILGNCRVVLTSMSGNFAGLLLSGSLGAGCKFCGFACTAWQFCRGCDRGASRLNLDTNFTAAYGTWKIKYNSSASKKLRKHGRITQAYNFKKAGDTAARMQRVEEWWARFGAPSVESDFIEDLEAEDEEDGEIFWGEEDQQVKSAAVFYSTGTLAEETADDDSTMPAEPEIENEILAALIGVDVAEDDAS
jgi:hypothetical protein